MPTHETMPTTATQQLDQQVHATLAKMNSSLSVASALLAATDWALHLAASPGKCLELAQLAQRQAAELAGYAVAAAAAGTTPATPTTAAAPAPLVQDRRYAAEHWQHWPYNVWQQAFLQGEQWWQAATQGVWGVARHHEEQVAFATRNSLDMFAPANLWWANPEVLRATLDQGGANLLRGASNALRDWQQQWLPQQRLPQQPAAADDLQVGRELARTPGKVVLRNELIELLQYAPAAGQVHAAPVLLVPAWIMKYYILDLSAHDSLVNYLVQRGHTVFCISWRNPGPQQRMLGMDDYLQQGWYAALDAVSSIVPQQRVHAAGYCLGGTLLSIAAAAMARDGDDRLASLTLFAAQVDFSEPGELGLFIDESQLAVLEAQMAERGVLPAEQMAGAFQLLRANDLLWSRMTRQYLLGEAPRRNDLMAWNADATRMPAEMHTQYLRRLFLNNDLADGRYPVRGTPVALSDIGLPAFMVATETDHVAPWRSVYKFHQHSRGDITFVLCSGGHNTGIVSPPGLPHRQYRIHTHAASDHYLPPEQWQAVAHQHEDSWWPAWQAWLAERSGPQVAPPPLGNASHPPLADAPGQYVMEK
ncbi:MAG: alpha/beta fold hydrolase [Burkholderiaceae bacterium]|nr:alpha/beta fold hydrolase [Burkholderiaceae bacterium]